jgi:predicted CoA-binding protein
MIDPACPLPTPAGEEEEAAIERFLAARRIAVVGISDDPTRPSHYVAAYLQSAGYEIIPINPSHEQVLGRRCYPTLADVAGQFDVVDVFRRPQYCADVTRDAIAAGAKGVWLQSGITSPEAQQLARDAMIDFIQNRCLMVEHRQRKR